MADLTALAIAARDGDRTALAAFVREAQSDVWRLCSHLVGRADADDITQEAFARALRALPSYRGESSARTWLMAITHRTCVDHIRRAQRRRLLLGRLQARPNASAATALGLGAFAGASDLEALVRSLPTDRRAAFVLTQVLGLGYEEAAQAIGVPIGTIRSRVARARADLIAAWGDEEVG